MVQLVKNVSIQLVKNVSSQQKLQNKLTIVLPKGK